MASYAYEEIGDHETRTLCLNPGGSLTTWSAACCQFEKSSTSRQSQIWSSVLHCMELVSSNSSKNLTRFAFYTSSHIYKQAFISRSRSSKNKKVNSTTVKWGTDIPEHPQFFYFYFFLMGALFLLQRTWRQLFATYDLRTGSALFGSMPLPISWSIPNEILRKNEA